MLEFEWQDNKAAMLQCGVTAFTVTGKANSH
jgi:hypothetical protein